MKIRYAAAGVALVGLTFGVVACASAPAKASTESFDSHSVACEVINGKPYLGSAGAAAGARKATCRIRGWETTQGNVLVLTGAHVAITRYALLSHADHTLKVTGSTRLSISGGDAALCYVSGGKLHLGVATGSAKAVSCGLTVRQDVPTVDNLEVVVRGDGLVLRRYPKVLTTAPHLTRQFF